MSVYPPDFWDTMITGTWGVDADVDSTVAVGSTQSLKFLSTAVATEIASGKIYASGAGHVSARCSAIVQASSVSAGNTVSLYVDQYNSSDTLLSTSTFFSGVLSAANTLEYHGSVINIAGSTAYVRIRLKKAANAFTVNWCSVAFDILPKYFNVELTSNQTIANTTTTKVATQVGRTGDPQGALDFASDRYTHAIGVAVMQFTASAWFAAPGAGKRVILMIHLNGTVVAEQDFTAVGTEDPTINVHTGPLLISPGDLVDQRVWQNSGGNLTLNADSRYTWFRGTCLWLPVS